MKPTGAWQWKLENLEDANWITFFGPFPCESQVCPSTVGVIGALTPDVEPGALLRQTSQKDAVDGFRYVQVEQLHTIVLFGVSGHQKAGIW